jgi:hypothetical protein
MTTAITALPLHQAASLPEAVAAGRTLAHTINNKLSLPIGVLELLEEQAELSEATRALITAARIALGELAAEVRDFQAVVTSVAS